MDCILPGSSAHGILQARIQECVAIPLSSFFSYLRHIQLIRILHLIWKMQEGNEWIVTAMH